MTPPWIEPKSKPRFLGGLLLLLSTDGEQYEFGNKPDTITAPRPAHLNEAILLGLTRMGILHTLALLTGSEPPDHGDGGVDEWVVVDSFEKDAAHPSSVSFELTVAGEPSGSVSLEIDELGRPVVRRQSVQFSSGEMLVVERYSNVIIEPGPGHVSFPALDDGVVHADHDESIPFLASYGMRSGHLAKKMPGNAQEHGQFLKS